MTSRCNGLKASVSLSRMAAATGKEGDASDIVRVVEKQYRDNLERTMQCIESPLWKDHKQNQNDLLVRSAWVTTYLVRSSMI